MNLFAVSFFGHREIDDPFVIERQLESIIRELLLTKEYVEFLVGRDGEFDQLVSSTVRRCKRTIRGDNSSLVLVLPYMTAEYRNNEESFHEYYDEIEICLESAEKHFKSAHQVRNRSMVDRSDLVIFCIEHNSGGAYQTMQYAKKGRCKDHESARCTSLTFALFFSERKNMNKNKRIAILFAVIIVAVGIIIAVTSHQKKEMDFDEFADRFEKSAEEVLGEDVRKVSKTELAATLTYGDQNDKDNNIYYRILKTTFYEGGPEEITGLHTEALGVLFPVDSMDSCEKMMIQDWPGALYKKDDTAFLCWTYSPEVTYVLEYTPSKIDDSEIIKMAESAEPVK